MQFDDKDFEKDDSNFPIEDDKNSISWEDLLNTDDEIDISSFIKDDAEKEEKAAEFDINEAANNYVNSLNIEEAGINTESLPPSDDIGDILDTITDRALLGEDIENKKIENIQDVVDDELLNLLDAKNEPVEDIKEDGKNVLTTLGSIEEPPHADEEDTSEDEFYPNLPKKRAPVLLYTLIGLIGFFAAVFFAVSFFFGPKDKDLAGAPPVEVGAKGPVSDVEAEKQTQELLDKVSVKEDKKDKEDKTPKTIVTVKFAGRMNPFVPSSAFDDRGFASFDADLSTPPDIEDTPEAQAARKLLTIAVTGIMYDPNKPSAIVKYNDLDYFVQRGDKIDDYIVNQITKDYVVLRSGTNTYKAYVGETFKLEDTMPESKKMKYNGGYRQYISPSDIQISIK